MKLVLACADLQDGFIKPEGGEFLKPIKDLPGFFSFMVGILPEIMVKLFFDSDSSALIGTKLAEAKKISKSKIKQKRNKKPAQPKPINSKAIGSSIAIENRVIIAKYIMLYPYMYSQITEKNDLVFDTTTLAKLISILNSDKLILSMLESVMMCFPDKDVTEELLVTYIKINVRLNPATLEYVLSSLFSTLGEDKNKVANLEQATNQIIKTCSALIPDEICFVILDFVKNTSRKYKHTMHKGKSELTDTILKEIVDKEYLRKLDFMQQLIFKIDSQQKEQGVNKAYEIVLDLISRTLTFMGHKITIYMPFVMSLINMYNAIVSKYQASLAEYKKSSTMSIAAFIMKVLHQNSPYFTKKPKTQKLTVDLDDSDLVELSTDDLENTKTVGKYFNALLYSLKASLALYYNRGKNVAFPEFTLPIQVKLNELAKNCATSEENINIKNSKMEVKDSRNKIYASRKMKILKLLDMVIETANATHTVRNTYAASVNVDSHQIDKMIEF